MRVLLLLRNILGFITVSSCKSVGNVGRDWGLDHCTSRLRNQTISQPDRATTDRTQIWQICLASKRWNIRFKHVIPCLILSSKKLYDLFRPSFQRLDWILDLRSSKVILIRQLFELQKLYNIGFPLAPQFTFSIRTLKPEPSVPSPAIYAHLWLDLYILITILHLI